MWPASLWQASRLLDASSPELLWAALRYVLPPALLVLHAVSSLRIRDVPLLWSSVRDTKVGLASLSLMPRLAGSHAMP